MPGEIAEAVEVKIPFEKGTLDGVHVPTSGPGPHPGVVVAHEILGLNDDIRAMVRRFAQAGYSAIAPDLFSGGPRPICVVRTILQSLGDGRPVNQLDAARAWLGSRPEVDESRIGAAGFCMGAGLVLMLGTRGNLKAVSVNYGRVPGSADVLDGVCPVVASYGAKDSPFRGDYDRLVSHLEVLDVPHDAKLYPEAAHSFMGKTANPVIRRMASPIFKFGPEPDAAQDAWKRVFAFFAEHVRDA